MTTLTTQWSYRSDDRNVIFCVRITNNKKQELFRIAKTPRNVAAASYICKCINRLHRQDKVASYKDFML